MKKLIDSIFHGLYTTVGEIHTTGCSDNKHKNVNNCPCVKETNKIVRRLKRDGFREYGINFWGDIIWIKGFTKVVEHHRWGR